MVEDDRTAAARAVAGDASAFERLYREHVGRIYALACRMVGPEEADDATQDVFVRAWRNLGQYRGDAAFGTWLYRLAINLLLGRSSQLATRRARFVADDGSDRGRPTHQPRVDLRMDFDAALDRLPPGARRIFVLHDVEGYTHDEIAGMLDVNAGTSKSQLHRARMTLRQYLA